jgi:GNAT superfamily N-acetyltransferase
MITIQTCTGPEVTAHLSAVADLRIAVFRDWPYLYDGDHEYEANYLATYAASPESLFVLAFDRDAIVGASTAIPLEDEVSAFKQPFFSRRIPYTDVFYFGESVLLPEYRGQGIGHRFFDERERYARRLGRFAMTAFCAVERDAHDVRRPPGYHPNDHFWSRRGYRRQDDMFCEVAWRELGDAQASAHRLRFWLRPLERE